jgi:hypothetical protein
MGHLVFLQAGALSAETVEAMNLIFWLSLALLVLGMVAAIRIFLPWFSWAKAAGKGLEPADCTLMVVGRHDAEGFERWIHAAYAQLPEAEIMAVDNQSEDDTANTLEALKRQYPSLIVVTLPASERFWSTRKLALTLAVKAAHRTHSIWVDTRCEVPADMGAWQRALTSPLRRGKAVASFAPVVAPRSASWKDRAEAMAANVWAHLRARPLFPAIKTVKTTGMVPVNIAFKTQGFFDIKGYLTSMHLDGGEAEFLLNDLTTVGPVVPVAQASAYLTRPWLPQKDPKMRAHRTGQERFSGARYGLLLLLVDLVAVAAALHLILLWIHMDDFGMLQPSPQIAFLQGQLQALLGVYLLLQLSFGVYLVQWAKRLNAGWTVGLLAPIHLRLRLLTKALTFWKK